MPYNYNLVERNSKDVTKLWKWLVIVLLSIMAVGGIAAAFSFNSVMDSFHQHCILGSAIIFSPRNETTEFKPKLVTEDNETTTTSTTTILPIEIEDEKLIETAEKKKNVFKFLHPDNGIAEPIEMNKKKLAEMNNDTLFFESNKIDEYKTKWGTTGSCDYLRLNPLLEAFIGIVWIAMFIMCGHGGAGDSKSSLVQPWRIVFPAFIFFILVTLTSFIRLFYFHGTMNNFCGQLKTNLTGDHSCAELLNIFSFVQDENTIKSGTSYSVTVGLAWMSALTWLLTVIVMCLRCFFAADFEIVTVGTATRESADNDLSSMNESSEGNDEYLLAERAKGVVTFESNL